MENMTVLSREMFDSALRVSNVREAARVLLDYRHYRTLGDILREFSANPNLKKQLVDGLLAWNPGDKREAVDRKVRNWMGGRVQTVDKETAFVLSRILELPLEKTDEFLKMATGEGIHWRNPEDIVWSYAVVQQLDFGEVRRLLEQAPKLGNTTGAAPLSGGYTAAVRQKLEPVLYQSQKELLAFLDAEADNLGTLHNTAYQQFMHSMSLLEQGFSDEDIEALFRDMTQKEKRQRQADALDVEGDTELFRPEKLTTRDVLETYLYRSLVPVRERSGKADPFYAIRRNIRQCWPDEFAISKMKSRQMDVTRKVLILLFLATDGSGSAFEQMEEDEELYTQDDRFLDIYTRLNLMLTCCGFQKLDPRSSFDWMVLFCISTGDLWECDARLQAMLMETFSNLTN